MRVSKEVYYFFLCIAIISSLMIIGISTTQITVILGGLGIGAGFGMQIIVENLISGLLIGLKKVIFVGDNIKITNEDGKTHLEGKILQVTSLSTVILDSKNEKTIVPNSLIYKNSIKISNKTPTQP